MASSNEVILEEIEALKAIMMDEVNIQHNQRGQPNAIEVTVKPATAQNIEEQHVRVTLLVNLPQGYPDEPPTINLRNPRGIDDDVIELIKVESIKKCEEYLGLPVIYELIELVREKLTANNTPSCPCAICLFHFTDSDHFTKTPCFHYFHCNCLGRYILNCEETAAAEEKENQQPIWMTKEKRYLLCPVCREPLKEEFSGTSLLRNPPPEEGKLLTDFNPTSPEIKSLQEKMKSLYLHQKSIGGIIDLEEERNKFLISAAVNLDPVEREASLVENVDASTTQTKEGKQGRNLSYKGNVNQHGNQEKCGANKSGSNQGKKEFTPHNGWWNGSRNRNNKRGHKGHWSKQSHGHTDNHTSNKGGEKSSVYEERPPTRKPPRQGPNKYSSRNSESQWAYESSCPPSYEETTKKSGRAHFNRNVAHRGGGSGSSSKRVPPPGFSELEQNIGSHGTS